MAEAKENDKVKVHYTGKLSDGQVFDTSKEREPIEFTIGEGQLIPGFEQGIVGMNVDEEKTVQIPSDEAYGEHREELLKEVPKDNLPEDITPEVGMGLVSKTPEGQEIQLVVNEIKDEAIIVDANHPLAGKDLTFELQLVAIT